MTGMPELVALFNGFGGASSLLVGIVAAFALTNTTFTNVTIILSILIGGVTLTGSLIAYGKLSERLPSKAIQFGGQQLFNGALVLAIIAAAVMFCLNPGIESPWLLAVIGLSLLFGIMITIPIGGADMPVVIAPAKFILRIGRMCRRFCVEQQPTYCVWLTSGSQWINFLLILCVRL